jgi:hypothetical protein
MPQLLLEANPLLFARGVLRCIDEIVAAREETLVHERLDLGIGQEYLFSR